MTNFNQLYRKLNTISTQLFPGKPPNEFTEVIENVLNLAQDERGDPNTKFVTHLSNLVEKNIEGKDRGNLVVAEIGGSVNSFLKNIPGLDVQFLSLFPGSDNGRKHIVADITNCPHLKSESFDLIYSQSVLEHVGNIHNAANEIARLLKPGGVTIHCVPFSYFFHGAPIDYWRVTPTAMQQIFRNLETIDSYFYSKNRRRNNLGSEFNPIGRDGDQFKPDSFGGWRENWHTIYIGRKTRDSAALYQSTRYKQTAVDLVKVMVENGLRQMRAIELATKMIHHISFDENGKTCISRKKQRSYKMSKNDIKLLWNTRSKDTIMPSPERFNLHELLKHSGLL